MTDKLFTLRKILAELTLLIDAQMPEAERLMLQGKDHEFLRVTSQLRKIAEAEEILGDLITVEVGEPSFGMTDPGWVAQGTES